MTADIRIANWRACLGAAAVLFALCVACVGAPSASASFSEYYGGKSLCGSNCYIQSAAAHTFVVDEGWAEGGSPALACQLFNSKSANEVTHGAGYCIVYYFGGEYVWGRVYNQSNKTFVVTGFAET
jgi:hypothetical protein